MTESLPRGNFGPGPTTLPAVSWFEFLLNDKLLENHLQANNTGKSGSVVIIQCIHVL